MSKPAHAPRVPFAALGMVPGGNPAFITIGPDGKAHVIGSPAAATPILLPPIVVPAATTNHVPSPSTSGTPSPGATAPATAPTSTAPATPTPTTTTLPGGPR